MDVASVIITHARMGFLVAQLPYVAHTPVGNPSKLSSPSRERMVLLMPHQDCTWDKSIFVCISPERLTQYKYQSILGYL